MEKIVSKIAALGVPGLVLVVAIHISGYAGAAAIIAALSSIGPGGIIGGILTLGLIGIIVHGLTEYGLEAILCAVIKELVKNGESKESIIAKVNSYPISKSLKCRLKDEVEKARI